MLKKMSFVFLLGATFLAANSNAHAEEVEKNDIKIISQNDQEAIVKKDGKKVKVHFDNTEVANNIDDNSIKDIVSQAEGSDNVTIHGIDSGENEETVDFAKESQESSLLSISPLSLVIVDEGDYDPQGLIYDYTTTKTQTIYNSPAAAEQVESVPQGGTFTFQYDRSFKSSAEISGEITTGGYAKLSPKMNATATYTYKVGIKLTGPAKGYASRIYYITRYKDSGTWKVVRKNKITGSTKTWTGSYSEATSATDKFYNWSRDVN